VVVILAAGMIVQHLPSTITGNSIYLPTPSSNSNPMSLFSPLSLDADRNDRVSCDYYCTTCGVPFLLLLGRGEGGQRTTTCGTTIEPDNTDVDVAQQHTHYLLLLILLPRRRYEYEYKGSKGVVEPVDVGRPVNELPFLFERMVGF